MNINKETILNYDSRYRAKLINSLSGFKPLNLIGTRSASGENLAIFNSVFHLGATPPLLGMISRPNSVPRHTLENIRESQSYTINAVSENLYERAHQTSARYNESEFSACKIEPEYIGDYIFAKESPLKLAMKFIREIPIIENDTIMIIGEIQNIEVNDNFIEQDGYIDLEKLDILCGASLDGYYKPKRIERLPYAKVPRENE